MTYDIFLKHVMRMEAISSYFLPTNVKSHQPLTITAKSSNFNTTFHHYTNKKLKLQTTIQNHNQKKQLSLLETAFNTLDDFICTFIDLPLSPSIDAKHVLSENFAPVDELPPTACSEVEGSLPSCLDGAYIRNGPNPQFTPKGPYHFLDGDGMLHMIKISKGKATFCSRYVSTHKYTVERDMGYPFVPNFIAAAFNSPATSVSRALLTLARVVAGQFDPLNRGFGTANTSLTLIGGQLYALCESDLPYAVKVTPDGDVITLGRRHFQSSNPFFRMTAHPKTDPATGDTFAFRYNIMRPFLTLFRINSQGIKQKDVAIHSIKGITAVHDFAITDKYAIIPDIQIVVKPCWILRGRSPVGVDAAKVPRLGFIPKYAEEDDGEMWWIDVEGLNMLHCVNAWEENGGERIRIVASNIAAVEHVFDKVDEAHLTMEVITVNVKARTVQRCSVSHTPLDFGVINPAYASKKNRYVYAAVIGATALLGVVKLDLSLMEEDCTVASRIYGPGCYGSEPFFVARDASDPTAEEDDGYLVTYVHDENVKESKFLVMDAKSPTLDIIASVKLPQRVPNGFHGLFVPESDLNQL